MLECWAYKTEDRPNFSELRMFFEEQNSVHRRFGSTIASVLTEREETEFRQGRRSSSVSDDRFNGFQLPVDSLPYNEKFELSRKDLIIG